MYLLWVLRGGLPDRRDYPWARIRVGFVQCKQLDFPEGADAGGRASTHGGERGVQQRRRCRRRTGVAGAGELKAFGSLHNGTPVPRGPAFVHQDYRWSSVVGKVSRWSFVIGRWQGNFVGNEHGAAEKRRGRADGASALRE